MNNNTTGPKSDLSDAQRSIPPPSIGHCRQIMRQALIVDDHALVREGMVRTLRRLGRTWHIREAADIAAALACITALDSLDLVVLDILLPGRSGFHLLDHLRAHRADIPIVVVSALDDAVTMRRAQRAGALGFVSKCGSGEALLDAARTVLAGNLAFPALTDGGPERSGGHQGEGLTVGQLRVLKLMEAGQTNRQIGDALGITEGTVKQHVSAILRTLGVTRRSEVLAARRRAGPSSNSGERKS